MFTGIIETVGTISNIRSKGNYKLMTVNPVNPFENIQLGESIAVDGCCLTVTECKKNDFTVEASQETLALAITGSYKTGQMVNLERALLPTSRLGGHMVSGHVDCQGKIIKMKKIGESLELSIEFPYQFDDYLVSKGSIAINGISLTVNEINDNVFTVNLIPFTRQETTVNIFKTGNNVNLEFDILGKYVVNLLRKGKDIKKGNNNLTIDKLIESGW